MSKFDKDIFYGGYDELAVSKEKYTKEQAIEIARVELEHHKHKYLAIGDGYTVHRAGVNEDGEPCVGWWLEYKRREKRSCPAWVFHTTDKTAEHFGGYEYVLLKPEPPQEQKGQSHAKHQAE